MKVLVLLLAVAFSVQSDTLPVKIKVLGSHWKHGKVGGDLWHSILVPENIKKTKSIKASAAIIEGEIVALDKNGVQCFEQLQNHTRDCAILYFSFDLLFLDGESLTDVPLFERKAHLRRILPKSMAGSCRRERIGPVRRIGSSATRGGWLRSAQIVCM